MKFEFSAGGVVYKKENAKTFVLVAKHSQHHGWVFPKGLIGDHVKGEKKEETALREVKEETGIEGKIVSELTTVEYWYQWEGEKRKKKVYYFLMEYVGGNTANHDHEMEKVEWIEKSKVEERLTYPSDNKVWTEAKNLLK
ncbi:MAG: MutT/nudix family protein [Parcubacteria group bacterium GW2011_GWC1_43_11]|nr:MAG: MutT/nudix family protein [Parcubacteria group bacterium GW2011_GWC1_43_11]